MILDSTKLNSLWEWARLQAPLQNGIHGDSHNKDGPYRRRVRLELSDDEHGCIPSCHNPCLVNGSHSRVMARVYLAEPRYEAIGVGTDTVVRFIPSELAPLAETRVF